MYERHLPHWRQDGATYFVTSRLGDSLPQSKLHELDGLRKEWERRHPPPRSKEVLEEHTREIVQKIEHWLDQGMGTCVLRKPQNAKLVVDAMHFFDLPTVGWPSQAVPEKAKDGLGRPSYAPRYELGAYVVMPNHVHAIVRPLDPEHHSLESILGSWKQYASKRILSHRQADGDFWQQECFDRIIRDEEHLWRTIQYIGRNPELAGLTPGCCPLWIRPEWQALGWKFLP
jgi:hypothetical protein